MHKSGVRTMRYGQSPGVYIDPRVWGPYSTYTYKSCVDLRTTRWAGRFTPTASVPVVQMTGTSVRRKRDSTKHLFFVSMPPLWNATAHNCKKPWVYLKPLLPLKKQWQYLLDECSPVMLCLKLTMLLLEVADFVLEFWPSENRRNPSEAGHHDSKRVHKPPHIDKLTSLARCTAESCAPFLVLQKTRTGLPSLCCLITSAGGREQSIWL